MDFRFQNTFVFQRRKALYLHRKGHNPRPLKSKHFVYDLIEDGNTIRKPDVKLILTDYVEGIGFKGDLVTVRPNRGYRELILPGLAVHDNPENREIYGTNVKLLEKRRSPFIERTINVFQKRMVYVTMNKFNEWTLEPWHIRVSMRKAGLYVMNDSQIQLPKEPITGPDPAKQGKEFYVTVTVNNEGTAKVRCRLHHFSLDPKQRELYVFEHWKRPADLLLPNDPEQVNAKEELEAILGEKA